MNSAIKKEEEKNYNNLKKKLQWYQHLRKKFFLQSCCFRSLSNCNFQKKLNHSSNFRVLWNTFAVKIRETQCSIKTCKKLQFQIWLHNDSVPCILFTDFKALWWHNTNWVQHIEEKKTYKILLPNSLPIKIIKINSILFYVWHKVLIEWLWWGHGRI